MKALKWILGIVVVLVVLAGAAIVALPYFVPMERIVAEGAAKVEEATGRKLTVGGEPELSVWPEVAIRLNDVAFANAPGAADANMATIEAVRVTVPVMPLLSGEVQVKEFVLVKPDIRLSVDENGKPNWDFGGKAAEDGKEKDAAAAAGDKPGLPDALTDFKLGDVRIEDGRVSYADAKAGTTEVLEDIDVSAALPSLKGPLELDGALTWKGERLELDLDMAKPLAAMEAAASKLKVAAKSKHIELDFDGDANFASGFALAGQAAAKSPSLKGLAAWAASPIEMQGDVLGPFEATGKLDFGGGKIAFSNANLAIDAIKGKGRFALDSTGAVPAIGGKLVLGALDLNPYLPAPSEGAGDGGGAKSGPGKWSTDPIDLSGLKAANARLVLEVESLKFQKFEIGKTKLHVVLEGGVLKLNMPDMALYGGTGAAKINVDAAKATPAMSLVLNAKGIEAQPLLKAAADFDRLSGAGDLNLVVRTAGGSQAALVSAANGKGDFAFKNGAVTGFNLGAMLRKVETAFLSAKAGDTQKTDFSELTASFGIKKGVVTNKDLQMLSPLFRVTGAGTSDMPKRRVDYRVEPKAVASATGQGGKADLAGVTVPVLISGPWHDISYKPDLAGALKGLATDPTKALDAVKGAAGGGVGAIKDAAGGLGKSVTGGGDANPVKKLKGLFGK